MGDVVVASEATDGKQAAIEGCEAEGVQGCMD